MKSFLIGMLIFILLAVTVGLVEQRKENARKADIQWAKEFAIRQREDSCASHIGKLTGAKHKAALKWMWSFSLAGKEHRMTEKDFETCLAF